jgi:hypothetical protein
MKTIILMEHQITYQTIINFLKPDQIVFSLGSSKKINSKENLVYYGLPNFSFITDYYLACLIFSLNKEDFVLEEGEFEEKMRDFKTFLKDNKIKEDFIAINQYFKINTIILGETNSFIPSHEMVDLFLPTILLYSLNNKLYPVTLNNQRIIFYDENNENDFILNFFENQPQVFNGLIKEYQLRDSIEESIDNYLNSRDNKKDINKNENNETSNNCFINQNEMKQVYTKMKKAELIEIILSKKDLSKSTLNKMKKDELLELIN